MKSITSDFLIIGAGIIGISISRTLSLRYPNCCVTLLEKEPSTMSNNSILNPGVIHSGIFYPSYSNKFKYCSRGKQLLVDYHKGRNIPLTNTGQLTVAGNSIQYQKLQDIYSHGNTNGLELHMVSPSEAMRIEPQLKIMNDIPVLYDPSVCIGSPVQLMLEVNKDLKAQSNVKIITGVGFKNLIKHNESHNIILATDGQVYESKFLINCAGLYSESIAKEFNIGLEYSLLPMKTKYLKVKSKHNKLKTLIQIIDNVDNEFINRFDLQTSNIHLMIDGKVVIGPFISPTFRINQHKGLKDLNIHEISKLCSLYFDIFLSSKKKDYLSLYSTHQAKSFIKIQQMTSLISKHNSYILYKLFNSFISGGTLPQLIDRRTYNMIEDLLLLRRGNSLHCLNITNPGWTCALAIAEDIDNLLTNKDTSLGQN